MPTLPKVLVFGGHAEPAHPQPPAKFVAPPKLSPAVLQQALQGAGDQHPMSDPIPPFLHLTPRSSKAPNGSVLNFYRAFNVRDIAELFSGATTSHGVILSYYPQTAGKRYLIDWSIDAGEKPATFRIVGPNQQQDVSVGPGPQHLLVLSIPSSTGFQNFTVQLVGPDPEGSRTWVVYSCDVTTLP